MIFLNVPSARFLVKAFALITLGSLIYAVAFNWFFLPNGLNVGGFTGLSQIVNVLLPAAPIGVLTLVMNVPLFVLGVRKMGLQMLFTSLYAGKILSI